MVFSSVLGKRILNGEQKEYNNSNGNSNHHHHQKKERYSVRFLSFNLHARVRVCVLIFEMMKCNRSSSLNRPKIVIHQFRISMDRIKKIRILGEEEKRNIRRMNATTRM